MADEDSILVERIVGVSAADQAAAIASLRAALHEHAKQVGDPEARLRTQPMTDVAVGAHLNSLGCVTAYISVTLDELLASSEASFEALLGERLADRTFQELEYEAVWALGKLVVLYVRGLP